MLEIDPFVSVGDVKFGMNRDEVHSVLGDDFELTQKGTKLGTITEFYEALGLFVFYDLDGGVRCIEAMERSSASYCGVKLVSLPLDRLLAKLKSLGVEHEQYRDIIVFPKLGIFAGDSGTGISESVAVYNKPGYDRYVEYLVRSGEELRLLKEEMERKGGIYNPFAKSDD